MKEKILQILRKYEPEDVLIYAHADHDGVCAAFGLNYLFGKLETVFSKPFRPTELPLENKKLLVVCDLLLNASQVYYCIKNGIEVVNLDHHDVLSIEHEKYLCLNPKVIYGKEFISSSGMIWKLFRPEQIAWILGMGSVGDLAIEDVPDLFDCISKQYPELVQNKSLYHSKIFELAQILLMSFDKPEIGFNLLKEAENKGYTVFYQTELYKLYLEKQKEIKNFLEANKDKIIQNNFFVAIDSSNQKYPGSYSVMLNLINADKRAYIEYANGRLFFRNYFGTEDVRALARLFGGSGPHGRTSSAYTKKSFIDIVKVIASHFNKKAQRSLI